MNKEQTPQETQDQDWQALVTCPDESFSTPDVARGVILAKGVPIWALICYSKAVDGDMKQVQKDYDLTEKEMAAALKYYEKYQKYVDALVLLNGTSWQDDEDIKK